jgi:lipopolysaccharide biosynthesis glycosyltransferase
MYLNQSQNTLHCVLCLDINYYSLAVNLIDNVYHFANVTEPIFHIICTSEIVPEFRRLSQKKDWKIELYPVNEEMLSIFPVNGHVSSATYYRLLIGDILPKNIKRVIYLDVDILVQTDLHKLWRTEMNDNQIIAAVKNDNYLQNVSRLKLKWNIYFNAGIMLIDLDRWRLMDIYRKALEVVESGQITIVWWDQDILNYLLDGKILELPHNWNYQLLNFRGQLWISYLIDRPQIIHFTGGGKNNKPWYFSCENIYGYKYRYIADKLSKYKGVGFESKRRKLKKVICVLLFRLRII